MAETDDRPAYSFSLGAPPEASRFLANKGWQPAFSWRDVEPEEHAVAFSVAKATSMDVLRDIREEVQAALDEGLTFREFQSRLQPRLEARGWWGVGEVTDPLTGEVRPGRLGTPRRLRTIYDANLRSARAAGQWERIERTKAALPYLTYRLGPSEVHRPDHATKEGLTLPVDDPFWDAWMPPNGWGCKCWVRQVTRRQAERLGIDESPDIPTVRRVNTRTGEIKDVPKGIDPGWERNPGRLRSQAVANVNEDKIAAMPLEDQQRAVRDVARSWAAQRMMRAAANAFDDKSIQIPPMNLPVGVLDDEVRELLGASSPIVSLTNIIGAKVLRKHGRVASDTWAIPDAIQFGEIRYHASREAHNFMWQVGSETLIVGLRIVDGKAFMPTFFYPSASYLKNTASKWEVVRPSGS